MNHSKTTHTPQIILLALLILFHIVNNYFWMKDDSSVGFGDTSQHLVNSLKFYNHFILKGNDIFQKIFHLFDISSGLFADDNIFFPRFVYLATAMLSLILGHSILMLKLSTASLYFIILIFSVYFLGCYYKNMQTGLFSSFIVSMYPGVFGLSREYTLDFPMTSMLCLCMLFFLKSEKFSKLHSSLIAGLFLGIGILTKFQIVFLVLPTSLYLLASGVKEDWLNQRKPFTKKRLINFLFSFSVAVAVTFVSWHGLYKIIQVKNFLPTWTIFKRELITSLHSSFAGKLVNVTGNNDGLNIMFEGYAKIIKLFSLENWLYYFKIILIHITPFMGIIAILAFLYLLKLRRVPKELLVWLLVPYFIFSLLAPKAARYIVPVFPAIALITACGIEEIKIKRIKIWVIIFIILINITQYFSYSYLGRDLIFKHNLVSSRLRYIHIYPRFKNNYQAIFNKFMKEIEQKEGVLDLGKVNIGVISCKELYLKGGVRSIIYYIDYYSHRTTPRNNLLNEYKTYDYLIVLNDLSTINPDFSQLYTYNDSNINLTNDESSEIIDYFKHFKIIDTDILENNIKAKIFLVSRKE